MLLAAIYLDLRSPYHYFDPETENSFRPAAASRKSLFDKCTGCVAAGLARLPAVCSSAPALASQERDEWWAYVRAFEFLMRCEHPRHGPASGKQATTKGGRDVLCHVVDEVQDWMQNHDRAGDWRSATPSPSMRLACNPSRCPQLLPNAKFHAKTQKSDPSRVRTTTRTRSSSSSSSRRRRQIVVVVATCQEGPTAYIAK